MWKRTKTSNLQKYISNGPKNGDYYAVYKIDGKVHRDALDTNDYKTAVRLKNKHMETVERLRSGRGFDKSVVTFDHLLNEYEKRTNQDASLKAATKVDRIYTLKRLKRTFPSLAGMKPARLSLLDVTKWADTLKNKGTNFTPPGAKKARKGNSPRLINRTVRLLSTICDMAVAKGLAADNVVRKNMKLERLTVKDDPSKGYILKKKEFEAILQKLEAIAGKSFSFSMRLIAYSGCRIGEARSLKWQHVDLENKRLRIPGEKTASADRVVPMNGPLYDLLKSKSSEITALAGEELASQKVMPINCLNKRLAEACGSLEINRITNHDLRDYFATTCLENKVPVHTVAAWLGHIDGGALLLRRYAHLRDQHAAEMAAAVTF